MARFDQCRDRLCLQQSHRMANRTEAFRLQTRHSRLSVPSSTFTCYRLPRQVYISTSTATVLLFYMTHLASLFLVPVLLRPNRLTIGCSFTTARVICSRLIRIVRVWYRSNWSAGFVSFLHSSVSASLYTSLFGSAAIGS